MKYRVGDIVVLTTGEVVEIKGIKKLEPASLVLEDVYYIGDFGQLGFETLRPYKFKYYLRANAIYIEERSIQGLRKMTYKNGDTVWYIDYTPRIKQGIIKSRFGSIDKPYYSIENTIHGFYVDHDKLFLTKEALLTAIDPPLHNFAVGQTVWYIEEADDPDTLRVEKATVISITNNTIEISIPHPCVPDFILEDLSTIFASPQEAVTKALELKQW